MVAVATATVIQIQVVDRWRQFSREGMVKTQPPKFKSHGPGSVPRCRIIATRTRTGIGTGIGIGIGIGIGTHTLSSGKYSISTVLLC